MSRILAVGDIHGCSNTFKKLILEEINIQKSDEVYCLGDYIDRGPDSKGVIDFILDLRKTGFQIHTLRGNHEQMMMDSINDEEADSLWRRYGGLPTLSSFGIKDYSELGKKYQKFFRETKFFFEKDNFIFVHAGMNFRIEDIFSDLDAMLWTRDFKVSTKKLGNRILIHGHTPRTLGFIQSQLGKNIINIDGGCVYNKNSIYGNMAAVDLTNKKIISIKCID